MNTSWQFPVARFGVRRLVESFTILVLTGCATSSITGSWRDGNFDANVDNILVIAVTANATSRRIFEDELVNTLRQQGVRASSAAQMIPSDEVPPEDQLKQTLESKAFGYALVTRVLSTEQQEQFVPASVYRPPAPYYGGLYDYYGRSHVMIQEPGHTVKDTIVTLEANLYATETAKLVWSATLQTVNPYRINEDAGDVAGLITKRLAEDELIRPSTTAADTRPQ